MSDFTAGMFRRLRDALLPREPAPPPPLIPTERAKGRAERDWAQRLERIAAERREQDALRQAAERQEAAAFAERQAAAREELLEICARNHGFYFPGDHAYPRDRFGALRQRHPLVAGVLDVLLGGRA